uniref:C-type lectin domain-containing protein n=1 Tax=Panagrellus redivivus TaxID=6233 RepID=A0A7E4V4M4_PANRE
MRTVSMKLLVAIFFIYGITLCDFVNFAHLCGYSLTGDTLVTSCSTADAADCADLCDVTDTCIGFEYFEETGDCNLINAIRNVESNYTFCFFFMKTTTKQMTIHGRTLSTTDQMLQDLLYESQGTCPDGWTTTSTKCTLKLSEEKCNEFAGFLNASYSNGLCTMPLISVKWTCPTTGNWTLKRYPDGHYCQMVVPRMSDPGGLQYYKACENVCAGYGGGLASIHSAQENNDYLALRPTTGGVAIGLITTNGHIYGNNSMCWTDKTKVTWNNWGPGPEGTAGSPFEVTIMMNDSLWYTNYPNCTYFVDNIACKLNATKVQLV